MPSSNLVMIKKQFEYSLSKTLSACCVADLLELREQSCFNPYNVSWLIWPNRNYAKTLKMIETLEHGYSSTQLFSESYPINTNMTMFMWFSKIFYVLVIWSKVAPVPPGLEGLRVVMDVTQGSQGCGRVGIVGEKYLECHTFETCCTSGHNSCEQYQTQYTSHRRDFLCVHNCLKKAISVYT